MKIGTFTPFNPDLTSWQIERPVKDTPTSIGLNASLNSGTADSTDKLNQLHRMLQVADVRPNFTPEEESAVDVALAAAEAALRLIDLRRFNENGNSSEAMRRSLPFRDVDPVGFLGRNVSEIPETQKTPLPQVRMNHGLPYLRRFIARSQHLSAHAWEQGATRNEVLSKQRSPGAMWLGMILTAVFTTVLAWGLTRSIQFSRPITTSPDSPKNSNGIADRVYASLSSIEKSVANFHSAQTVAEKLNYVREGTRIGPVLEDYYRKHADEKNLESFIKSSLNWVERQGALFVYGLAVDCDGGYVQYTVELTDNGPLLDWRALTGWTGLDWADLTNVPTGKAIQLCTSVSPDTLYQGEYSDPSEWLSFKLTSPDRQHVAWAYIRRGSNAEKQLPLRLHSFKDTVPENITARRLTLEVQSTPIRSSNTAIFEITSIPSEGWIQDFAKPQSLRSSEAK